MGTSPVDKGQGIPSERPSQIDGGERSWVQKAFSDRPELPTVPGTLSSHQGVSGTNPLLARLSAFQEFAASRLGQRATHSALKRAAKNIRLWAAKDIGASDSAVGSLQGHTCTRKVLPGAAVDGESVLGITDSTTIEEPDVTLSGKPIDGRETIEELIGDEGKGAKERATPKMTRDDALASLDVRRKSLGCKEKEVKECINWLSGDDLSIDEIVGRLRNINPPDIDDVSSLLSEAITGAESGYVELEDLKTEAEEALQQYVSNELEPSLVHCKRCSDWSKREKQFLASGDLRASFKGTDMGTMRSTELVNVYEDSVEFHGKGIQKTLRCGVICQDGQVLSYNDLVAAQEGSTEDSVARLNAFEKKQQTKGVLRKMLAKLKMPKRLPAGKQEAIHRGRETLTDPAKLAWAIAERKFILEQKMVRYVQMQMEAHPEQIKEGRFSFMQLSLLRPSTKKMDKSGFAVFEGTALADMEAAFEMFRDKEIVFEDTASVAYIDAQGVVHMPTPEGGDDGQRVTLNPLLANVSVQQAGVAGIVLGRVKKEDIEVQKGLNGRALDALSEAVKKIEDGKVKQEAEELLNRCKEGLQKGESSYDGYEIAEDLAMVAHLAGLPLGLNCFSAKDRTSFVNYRLNIRALSRHLRVHNGEETGEQEVARVSRWGRRALDMDTVGGQIVRANGFPCMKISPLFLPGYTGRALPKRIAHLCQQKLGKKLQT